MIKPRNAAKQNRIIKNLKFEREIRKKCSNFRQLFHEQIFFYRQIKHIVGAQASRTHSDKNAFYFRIAPDFQKSYWL